MTRRTYQFNFDVNYLRSTSLSGSLVSDNNNSYVMEPTSTQEVRMQISVVAVVVVVVIVYWSTISQLYTILYY